MSNIDDLNDIQLKEQLCSVSETIFKTIENFSSHEKVIILNTIASKLIEKQNRALESLRKEFEYIEKELNLLEDNLWKKK